MDIWFISFIGGFVGSVLMDITEAKMAKSGISSGVTAAYIGRWLHGLSKGKLFHHNIIATSPVANEARAGILFHFIVGGGMVALAYPLLLLILGFTYPVNHLLLATLFGLVTSFLPWFILMPAFGWGLFGAKAPTAARPVISPMLSHLPYGFGIGLTLTIYYAIFA